MLELVTMFGAAAAGALAATLWEPFAGGDSDTAAVDPEPPVETGEPDLFDALVYRGDPIETGAVQVADFDSVEEVLLIGVPPDYEGIGRVEISESADEAGTALVSLDGSVVAELPGAYGSLSMSAIELVELDGLDRF